MSTDILLHTSRVERSQIQASKRHRLRRVAMSLPSICWVRQGCKRLLWASHAVDVGPGQLLLLPAGMELEVINLPGAQGYLAEVVMLPPPLIEQFRQRHGELLARQLDPASHHSLSVPLEGHTAIAWQQLLASLADNTPPALQQHYAHGVLLALSLEYRAGPILLNRQDPLSARVQQLLMHDPAAAWSATAMAQQLNMGVSTFRRHLAQEGKNFLQIVEDLRLGQALGWLQTTNRPIGEIALASGYASSSRFSIRFRKHYGLSPRELRKAL